MLIAILILLCAIFWIGMVCVYFREELRFWLDNKYGPERRELKPAKKQFWRFYD